MQYYEGLDDAKMLHGKRRTSARRGWMGEKGDVLSNLVEGRETS